MIIDFHTHVYPPKIAADVIKKLAGISNVQAFTDATAQGLIESCVVNDIEKSVILPVVTNPKQTETINRIAVETNESNDRLISFGGIHPDNDDYRRILAGLADNKIPGVKLHPVFQKTDIDDLKYMRIVDCACEYGLIVSVHAGYDINDPGALYASTGHIGNLIKEVKPDKLVLAHMGGHLDWNNAEKMLSECLTELPSGKSLYLDTAFCLPSPVSSQNIDCNFIANELFVHMVRLAGADRVLFGTDSPWTDQGPSVKAVINSGLTEKEISRILYDNAKDLLTH